MQTSEESRRAVKKRAREKRWEKRRGEPVSLFTNTSIPHPLPEKPCRRFSHDCFVISLSLRARSQAMRDFKIRRKKENLRSFSLNRGYSYPLTLSKAGETSWSYIPGNHIQIQKEK